MDPWKDLSASLVKLHDTYYMQHGKMVNRTTMYISESPAAEECAREPYAGAWSPTPNLAAVTSLFLPVAGALDHLLAMATLLTGPPSMYAPFTVARSVLEISVQTWYLLEPGIGAEERALRSVNVRLRSLWEQSQLVGVDESPEWRAQLDHVQRRMDEIVAAARARNISARGRGDGRRSPWVGSGPKSTVKLADECLGSAVPGLGSTFWRSLSSVAHGQAHGLVQAFRPAVDGSTPEGGGGPLGQLSLSARQAALYAAGAPLACMAMLNRLYAYLGWDETELQSAAQVLLTTWTRVGQLPRVGPATY